MYTQELQKRIDEQEKKDRYVAERCLREEILKSCNQNLIIIPTPTTCKVDLKCSVNTTHFNVEIKERNKNIKYLKENPIVELKVSKLMRMRQETDEDTRLFYMVLLNQNTCYLFDLDNIDWEEVECKMWHIKKTQLDDDSAYEDALTYYIPIRFAVRKCSCTQYFKDYNNKYLN